jgi:L-threonine kinase
VTGQTLAVRRTGADVRSGTATAHGTFGELLQGALPGGVDFLVTLPITRRSLVRFRHDPDGPLRVYPADRTKSLELARAMLEAHGGGAGGTLVLDSDLPVGKGLASSSADLVATARAVARGLGLDDSPPAVERWLRPIEPTDGVMYPDIVVFEHRAVRLRATLGALPQLTVVAVDEGGLVDTVAFNRRPKHYSEAETAHYAHLVAVLEAAVREGDLSAVGAVATRSARLNQRLAPKRNLAAMTGLADRLGALGVVCAHSGTMLGLLLDEAAPDYGRSLAAARTACAGLPGTTVVFRTAIPEGTEHAHAA